MSMAQNHATFLTRLKSLFRRADPEQAHRQWLMSHGRITEGIVVDLVQHGNSVTEKDLQPGIPCAIVYRYSKSGLTYETCQTLSAAQLAKLPDYRIGNCVNVRYNPNRPMNSCVE